jgi:hypothetical protein
VKTYGKRKTVYAKWKTNFTFTQTAVYEIFYLGDISAFFQLYSSTG